MLGEEDRAPPRPPSPRPPPPLPAPPEALVLVFALEELPALLPAPPRALGCPASTGFLITPNTRALALRLGRATQDLATVAKRGRLEQVGFVRPYPFVPLGFVVRLGLGERSSSFPPLGHHPGERRIGAQPFPCATSRFGREAHRFPELSSNIVLGVRHWTS